MGLLKKSKPPEPATVQEEPTPAVPPPQPEAVKEDPMPAPTQAPPTKPNPPLASTATVQAVIDKITRAVDSKTPALAIPYVRAVRTFTLPVAVARYKAEALAYLQSLQ